MRIGLSINDFGHGWWGTATGADFETWKSVYSNPSCQCGADRRNDNKTKPSMYTYVCYIYIHVPGSGTPSWFPPPPVDVGVGWGHVSKMYVCMYVCSVL